MSGDAKGATSDEIRRALTANLGRLNAHRAHAAGVAEQIGRAHGRRAAETGAELRRLQGTLAEDPSTASAEDLAEVERLHARRASHLRAAQDAPRG